MLHTFWPYSGSVFLESGLLGGVMSLSSSQNIMCKNIAPVLIGDFVCASPAKEHASIMRNTMSTSSSLLGKWPDFGWGVVGMRWPSIQHSGDLGPPLRYSWICSSMWGSKGAVLLELGCLSNPSDAQRSPGTYYWSSGAHYGSKQVYLQVRPALESQKSSFHPKSPNLNWPKLFWFCWILVLSQ